jgi:hypothetical protein
VGAASHAKDRVEARARPCGWAPPPPPPLAPPPDLIVALYPGPRFTPKALRLGIGQSVGLLTFQECLKLMGAQHSAADDQQEADAAALIAD